MKNSDRFSGLMQISNYVGRRIATTALFMVAAITMAFAQEPYSFIEGSTHSFHVTPGDAGNTLAWGMYVDPYNEIEMPVGSYEIPQNGMPDVAVTFTNLDRVNAEMVYLVVRESAPNGCSTRRAIQINILPNTMYLDFAALPNANDCYYGDKYSAEVLVGMNFKVRGTGGDSPIPESRFPLKVTYKVVDMANPTVEIPGNGGNALVMNYDASNNYFLDITETMGSPTQTTTYNVIIDKVVDKYQAEIKHDKNRRLQIRVIHHLPQSSPMDMAMAYEVTGIEYIGAR